MNNGFSTFTIAALLLVTTAGSAKAGELKTQYLYNLSDFTGPKRFSSAKIAIDDVKNEIYAMSGESVGIFNSSGMEIYRFDHDPTLGVIYDVAVDPAGDLFMLALKERNPSIIRCNFRAEPMGRVELKNCPAELKSFIPDRLSLRDGRLYLTSLAAMQVVIIGTDGNFIENIDLAAKVGLTDQEKIDSGIGSLTIDRSGNILFTIPVLGKVYRLDKERKLTSFGKRGSGPGKFGVVAGVTTDRDGNLIVADTLRCAVMVFDRNFKFIKEFGFRGFKPGNLIGPGEILVDSNNRIYVSQIRKRGVSVFQISNG